MNTDLRKLIGRTVRHAGDTWRLASFGPKGDTPCFQRVGGGGMLWELDGYDLAWARRAMGGQTSGTVEQESRRRMRR